MTKHIPVTSSVLIMIETINSKSNITEEILNLLCFFSKNVMKDSINIRKLKDVYESILLFFMFFFIIFYICFIFNDSIYGSFDGDKGQFSFTYIKCLTCPNFWVHFRTVP